MLRPFFEAFCVIDPKGHRTVTPQFFHYCNIVVEHCPQGKKRARYDSFVNMANYETKLEEKYWLPDTHLVGITEAYPILAHCATIARNEELRLKLFLTDDDRGYTPEVKDHLKLMLVTSISKTGEQTSDISKKIIQMKRHNCSCLLCLPGIKPNPLDSITRRDWQIAAAFLKINFKAVATYIPFRSKYSRNFAQDFYSLTEE